VPTTTGRLV